MICYTLHRLTVLTLCQATCYISSCVVCCRMDTITHGCRQRINLPDLGQRPCPSRTEQDTFRNNNNDGDDNADY